MFVNIPIRGILGKYIDKVSSSSFCENSLFKPIEYENIFTAFIVFAIGDVIAIFVAIFEKIYFWTSKKQKKS